MSGEQIEIQCHHKYDPSNRGSITRIAPGDIVRIGTNEDCEIRTPCAFVSPEAAQIYISNESAVELKMSNRNGGRVNGIEVPRGKTILLGRETTIDFGNWLVMVRCGLSSPKKPEQIQQSSARPRKESSEILIRVHEQLLDEAKYADRGQEETVEILGRDLPKTEQIIERLVRTLGLFEPASSQVRNFVAGQCLESELVGETLQSGQTIDLSPSFFDPESRKWHHDHSADPRREHELRKIMDEARESLGIKGAEKSRVNMQLLVDGFRRFWEQKSRALRSEMLCYLSLRKIRKDVKDMIFGYGPLEDLLRDPTISEIMINTANQILIERQGVIENSGRQFVSEMTLRNCIDRIAQRAGRRIDISQPVLDARLSDGSRVNAVIPPIAVDGSQLTIRKFPLQRMTTADLTGSSQTLTSEAAVFLEAAVRGRRNILISGGTGTGKTTLLNCISGFIPSLERVVTIEDTAELRLNGNHVVRMEARPATAQNTGAVTIESLVKNALRMRPDRIIVGECRGGEALWMLQAMNTGHDGCLTTIHANSPKDAIMRLEVMLQSSGAAFPIEAIHRQISSALHLIVQLERLHHGPHVGRRVVKEICEVLPSSSTANTNLQLRQLFVHDGEYGLTPTGRLPSFLHRLVEDGLIEANLFFAGGNSA